MINGNITQQMHCKKSNCLSIEQKREMHFIQHEAIAEIK